MKSVEALRKALRAKPSKDFDKDCAQCAESLETLAKHGAAAMPAMPEVLAQLDHGDNAVRTAAIGVLRELDPAAASAAIIAFASAAKTRKQGIKALQVIAMHYDGVAALARGFGFAPKTHPLTAQLRDAVPLLIAALADTKLLDQYRRCWAAYALGIFGRDDDAAFAALHAAVADDGPHVRDRTAYALRFFGKRAVPPLRVLQRDRGEADKTATKSLAWIRENFKTATAKPKSSKGKKPAKARARK